MEVDGAWCASTSPISSPHIESKSTRFRAGTWQAILRISGPGGPTRAYPFHVVIPDGAAATGVAMVEQVKSIDFRSGGAKRIGKAPAPMIEEVLSVLDACIF